MILALAPLLLLRAATVPSPPSGDARSVIERLERRQRGVVDIVAGFTQTYRSGALGHEIVERGELRLKRPGRMRWEYKTPDVKLLVADGEKFFFYVPADRQVTVTAQSDQHSVAAVLLTGRTSLLEEFSAAADSGAAPGLVRVRLTPRKQAQDVDHVLVDVDAEARIRSIHVVDSQNNTSRFDFVDIRENTGIPDRLFRFETPKGVEVIEG